MRIVAQNIQYNNEFGINDVAGLGCVECLTLVLAASVEKKRILRIY